MSNTDYRSPESRIRSDLSACRNRLQLYICRGSGWTVEDVRAHAIEALGLATALVYITGDNDECLEWKAQIRESLAIAERELGATPRALPASVCPLPPTE